ncbi:penicillin acylase family protein [Microbulbifer hydrolyticus]|uniref:Penicillin acylase family protein n=1 Tax=Microbulbifer hydrolyticus TaxID=48074 RepID=A0A6P1TBU5_9GAMM|nr:penicillin acylase family protein [Microbulbifer hydrolyticus]MBB5210387.1 penicillin amidase [Microbulbifer hydrolyticus]QHQ39123.1 penicillin acylase family protein [Microbulbifer hydrolyticus]
MMNSSPWAKRILRGFIALLVLLLLVALATWAWLRQSLPLLNGELSTGQLAKPVSIERDAQGVAFITAETRTDSAFALGFLHAQERFFQMDLLRRNSAGELSELVGEAALEHDKGVRVHQFRARAERNIGAMPVHQQQVLQSYADGVNYGLSQLGAKPWEYALLRQEPRKWVPADSMLTIFSMYLTLQSRTGDFELRDNALAELLPGDLYHFFAPKGGVWDAPLIGDARDPLNLPETHIAALVDEGEPMAYGKMESEDMIFGSNNWVVGGALTEHGAAIVADDMHLAITVPNIWFRAGWNVPGTEFEMRGASLPGGPIIVAGSNGKVAWGFTNTTADWGDLIPLEISENGEQYRTPEGWQDFDIAVEQINISGKPASELKVRKTIWGPVVGEDHNGTPLAYRWVAHDIRGANLNLLKLETVETVRAAMDIAPELGMPHQNFVLGDSAGNIGWTVAGPIPRRVGLDGDRSVSWADGTAFWDGFLPLAEQPSIYNPPSHRIWTANSRTMDGEFLRVMGDGGYALGARQQQIRDDLFARDHFTEQDLLDIQLDDRAIFLERWQAHLVQLLSTSDGYDDVLEQVKSWGGRASADSVGYRIVRNFRLRFIDFATAPVLTYMQRHDPTFKFGRVNRQVEYPAWEMLSNEPAHLLNPEFASWKALKLAALDQVLEEMAEDGLPLAQQTWGVQNSAKILHPLGRAVSAVNWFTAMPADPLPGDSHMPRFQSSTNGASERMVVAPGHEELGVFHMATGQSAHPLSPFFGNGHRDWVEGNPSSFTEKSVEYVLTLK